MLLQLLIYFSISLINLTDGLTVTCVTECICSTRSVTCRDITEIPSEITGKDLNSLEAFLCTVCQIQTLGANSFNGYSMLTRIAIKFSNMSEIEPGAFSGLETQLVSLELSDNSFTKIRSHYFSGLTVLDKLDMQSNQIGEIEEGSFDDLSSLKTILLKTNQILTLPDYIFSSTVVTEFDFSDNSINLFTSLPFPSNGPTFSYIYFSDNNIARIHSNISSIFTDAGSVRLGGNPLICDCYLTGLQSLIQSFPTKFSDSTDPVTCQLPNSVNNQKIVNITIDPSGCLNLCLNIQCSVFGACFSESDWPVCRCNTGYYGNGHICIDPCQNSNCGALATCIYSPVSMNTSCVCPMNYRLDNSSNCVELIGCDLGLCPVNSTCFDTVGGFQCICNAGLNFTNFTNALSCIDANECRNASLYDCPENSGFVNSFGNYTCECLQGFEKNSSEVCVDINECSYLNMSCTLNSHCLNIPGSFNCVCNPGFEEFNETCIDIDECGNTTNCPLNSVCNNTICGFECNCVSGFEKIGAFCLDRDECSYSETMCMNFSTCFNNVGSFACNCNSGFELKLNECVDKNECLLGTHNCRTNENCVNNLGSFACIVCQVGFLFVNSSCQDINECEFNICPSNSACFNKPGFHECICNAGYFLVNNGLTCETTLLPPFCAANSKSGFEWPGTSSNTTVTIVCPNNNQEFAKRNCDTQGIWDLPDISNCISPQIAFISDSLNGLSPTDPDFTTKLGSISIELTDALKDTNLIVSDYLESVQLFRDISSKSDYFIQIQRSYIPTALAMDIFMVASSIVDLEILESIQKFDQTTVQSAIINVLSSTESLTQNLVHTLFSEGNRTQIVIETDNILVDIQRIKTEVGFVVTFNTSSGDTRIDIPLGTIQSATFSAIDSSLRDVSIENCETSANFFNIKNIQQFLTQNLVTNFTRFRSWYCEEVDIVEAPDQVVNSDHLSASISSRKCDIDTNELDKGLVIVFKHSDNSLINSQCVYTTNYTVDMTGAVAWDTLSCEKLQLSNRTHTFCNCTHLTSFAILMSPDPYYSSGSEMSIFSYVGLSISIIFLTISLLSHFLKLAISESVLFVHRNLIFSILLSQIIFVIGIERNEVREFCLIIAALLHYILLVSFLWMLIEAVNALILIRRPFIKQFWLKVIYACIAYFLPFIIVSITLGISICDYGHYPLSGSTDVRSATSNCWLPRRGGRYWAFIGPALFIIAINTLLLFAILGFILRLQFKRKRMRASSIGTSHTQTLAKGLASAVKATLLMVPVLGITWIFGVFALNSINIAVSQVFQWLFLIFNCYQGVFIFIFYCLLNAELRIKAQLLVLRKVLRQRTNREDLKEIGFFNIARREKDKNNSPIIDQRISQLSADRDFKDLKSKYNSGNP